MLVPGNGTPFALGAEEQSPFPLEGGFGRAPKHNAEIMRSRSCDEEPTEHPGSCDGSKLASTHTADCPGLRPGGRWPRIICAMFKCPPQRAVPVRRALTVDSKLTESGRSTAGPAR